jgi:cytochrome c556
MITKLQIALMAGLFSFMVGSSFAQASGDDAITARQVCMKANGAAMKTFVPMLKGEMPYDTAAVQTVLTTMDAACTGWKDFWPADSKTSVTLKSRSADAVWSDPKGLEDSYASYLVSFTALKATKDEAGFKSAFPVMGKSCGGCHEKFRAPE